MAAREHRGTRRSTRDRPRGGQLRSRGRRLRRRYRARTSDPDARPVIIENQLAQTDHSHLGQLLTYAAGRDAAIVVWISARVRDEHRSAIDWLNSISEEGIDFFAIEVEALRIDASSPAAHFKIVAQLNQWTKQTKNGAVGEVTEQRLRYQRFHEVTLEEFKKRRPGLTSASKLGPHTWLGFTAGRRGFAFNWSFSRKCLAVELYIDTEDRDLNRAFFDALHERAKQLQQLGPDLSWERLDNRRASRLAVYHSVPAAPPPDEDPQLQSWAIETMVQWNDMLRDIVADLEPATGLGPADDSTGSSR